MHLHVKAGEPDGANPTLARPIQRHHALDLVRGLAALAVAQYHFMTWNKVATIESMGTFAVYVFFVLSGLTMMMVYAGRFGDGASPAMVRDFFRKRAARLLPLLAVVAVLSCIRQALSTAPDIPAAVLTATGLMALHMPGFVSNSVGAWSLGVELAFYAVFPTIAMLTKSWKPVAAVTLILVAGQHLLLWKIGKAPVFWDYYISNLVFAPFFALGILIYFDRRPRHLFMLAITLTALVTVLGYSLVAHTDLMQDQLSYLRLTVGCGAVIWAAWRSNLPAWMVPIGAFLGDISYSLYLTHWIANDIVRVLHLPIAMHWALFSVVTLIGSYLCYRFFESPMRTWLGSRGARTTVRPAA